MIILFSLGSPPQKLAPNISKNGDVFSSRGAIQMDTVAEEAFQKALGSTFALLKLVEPHGTPRFPRWSAFSDVFVKEKK